MPVTGTFTDALGGAGTVTGTFRPDRFFRQGGDLMVTGTFVATLVDSTGTVLGTVTRTVTMAAEVAQATCQILQLDLGPLHLRPARLGR